MKHIYLILVLLVSHCLSACSDNEDDSIRLPGGERIKAIRIESENYGLPGETSFYYDKQGRLSKVITTRTDD